MGAEFEKYRYRAYSARYPLQFVVERRRIHQALGDASIEHIGSTAVRGLGGKGVIDVSVGVQHHRFGSVKKKLITAGYSYHDWASKPERLFFQRDYSYRGEVRRVHLHLVAFKGKEWSHPIAFRDFLRMHPTTCREYERVKREAVRRAKGDGDVYRRMKDKFVRRILREAVLK